MSLELEKVSYLYQRGTPFACTALTNLSLHIDDGEMLGIMGEVGSGKSTLLQLLNGLILPTTGRVWVDGEDTSCMNRRELARLHRTTGLVFQQAESQIFSLGVFNEVAFGPRNAGLAGAEVNERVEWALSAAGLAPQEYKTRLTRTLSAGEKRRVALASILALKPRYLLLDEPTSGLDYAASRTLLATIAELNQIHGSTVIMASHNLRQLLTLMPRIVYLKQGEVWLDLQRDELLLYYESLRQQGVILPDVVEILYQLNGAGWKLAPTALTSDTLARAITQRLALINHK